MPEPRDGWSKLDILLKVVASVALPIALFMVGHQFTLQQQAAAEASRQLERLNSLLTPLSSDNLRQRKLAIVVAGHLAKNGQLPPELLPVLITIASEDPSPETVLSASNALTQVAKASPQLRSEIETSLKAAPARIYVHVNTESQRDAAVQLGSKLSAELGPDFVVPGVEKQPGPSSSELRYFKEAEKDEAERIAQELETLGVVVKVQSLSSRYESSDQVRPRHFELWLGDNFARPER